MEKYNVFIDSNIFIKAKYNFNGGSLNALKTHCNNEKIKLFTNDIIIQEVEANIKTNVAEFSRQAKNAIKSHAELLHAITPSVYEEIESKLLAAPDNLLSAFYLYIENATKLSNDGLSMISLFNDYFHCIAPFESKKKEEFPDAVTIMSIKRYLENSPDTLLHIISEDNGWHNAFKDTENVLLYKDLRTLLDIISKEEQLYTDINYFMKQCANILKTATEDWCYEQDWSSIIEDIDLCMECNEIEDIIFSDINLKPNGIEYIDKQEHFASANYHGTASFRLEFNYIDHTYEIYDREDHKWYNSIYGKGAADIKVSFASSVTILITEDQKFELDSPSFDEVTLIDVDLLEYCLEPYHEDDFYYF